MTLFCGGMCAFLCNLSLPRWVIQICAAGTLLGGLGGWMGAGVVLGVLLDGYTWFVLFSYCIVLGSRSDQWVLSVEARRISLNAKIL